MNRLKFVMQLIDKVSSPARRGARSLDKLRRSMERVRGAGMQAAAGVRLLGDRAKRLRDNKAVQKLNGMADGFLSVAKHAAMAGAATGAFVGYKIVEGTSKAAAHLERMRKAFTAFTGSASAGETALARSEQLAKDFGLNIKETQKQYAKLLSMQFKAGEVEELIKFSTDLKGAGQDEEATKRFLTAITQIKAKGRLQAEELTGQLAEAGVATTLVYEELAKTLNTTAKKVPGLITNGMVDADMGIDAVKKALLKKLHMKEAGELGKTIANDTLAGLLGRMKAAPDNFFIRIAKASGPGMESLKKALGGILAEIDALDANKFAEFVSTILDGVRDAVPLMGDFATGFGEGFRELMDSMRGPGGKIDAKSLGKGVAQFLSLVVKALKQATRLAEFLQTPGGQATGWVVLSAMAFGKVATVAASVIDIARSIAPVFKGVGKAFAWVWSIGSKAFGGIAKIIGTVIRAVTTFGQVAWRIGSLIFSSPLGALLLRAFGLTGAAISGFKLGEFLDTKIPEMLGLDGTLSGRLGNAAADAILGEREKAAKRGTMDPSKLEGGALTQVNNNDNSRRSVTYAPVVTVNAEGMKDPKSAGSVIESVLRSDMDRFGLQAAY